MTGFFGNMFDLNNDGKLDAFEQAMDLSAFLSLQKNLKDDDDDLDNLFDDLD